MDSGLGGQLENDSERRLFLIYPEGNWVEVRSGTPYVIIGESRYGKPLLDRLWRYDCSLSEALRDGLLAFDATRASAADVDYPTDVGLYRNGTNTMLERRFSREDLQPLSDRWMQSIREAASDASPLVAPLFASLESSPPGSATFDAA